MQEAPKWLKITITIVTLVLLSILSYFLTELATSMEKGLLLFLTFVSIVLFLPLALRKFLLPNWFLAFGAAITLFFFLPFVLTFTVLASTLISFLVLLATSNEKLIFNKFLFANMFFLTIIATGIELFYDFNNPLFLPITVSCLAGMFLFLKMPRNHFKNGLVAIGVGVSTFIIEKIVPNAVNASNIFYILMIPACIYVVHKLPSIKPQLGLRKMLAVSFLLLLALLIFYPKYCGERRWLPKIQTPENVHLVGETCRCIGIKYMTSGNCWRDLLGFPACKTGYGYEVEKCSGIVLECYPLNTSQTSNG